MSLNYEQRLEHLVQQLLPYYYKYHELLNLDCPDLDPIVTHRLVKKEAALFKPKIPAQKISSH